MSRCKKLSVLGDTVIVVDDDTMRWVFAHRLLCSAYSKRQPSKTSKKQIIHQLARKRPRLELLEPTGEQDVADEWHQGHLDDKREQGEEADLGQMPSSVSPLDQQQDQQRQYASGEIPAPGPVPGDHRVHMRTNLANQEEFEDRRQVGEEFTTNVVLPLRMMPEEAYAGVKNGCIRLEVANGPGKVWIARKVVNDNDDDRALSDSVLTERMAGWSFPSTRFEKLSARVFEEVWRRGWIMTRGTNFGCDFLLYTSDPGTTHSTFMIVVTDQDKEHLVPSHTKWCAIAALATKVRKTALLACVAPEQDLVTFTMIEGCLFRRSDFLTGQQLEAQALAEDRERERLRKRRENLLASFGAAEEDDAADEPLSVAV